MRFSTIALAAAFALGTVGACVLPAPAKQDLTMPTCASGDPAVWVNTKSKVFHPSNDPIYTSHTKNGQYACTSDAVKMGAHQAKMSGGKKGSDTGSMKAPGTMASPKQMMAPQPMVSPAPAAT
jgi:hypothetical protein